MFFNRYLYSKAYTTSSYEMVHVEFMNVKWLLVRKCLQWVPYIEIFGPLLSAVFVQKAWCHKTSCLTGWTSPSTKCMPSHLPYLGSIFKNTRQEVSHFLNLSPVVNRKLRCFQKARKLQNFSFFSTIKVFLDFYIFYFYSAILFLATKTCSKLIVVHIYCYWWW